ncbi:MAG: M20/M25/M40 family metallo-hydrolase, partial [Acutalibacteraceae bacterium]
MTMFDKVLEYFRLICSLPHGSGNTGLISDLLCDFASARNLRYLKDGLGDVIIFKNGTEGYETSPAVILQGHIDMVCVKDEGVEIDFKKDGLSLSEDENYIWANGTSLGGDDGIAVAYMLAILDSDSLSHPPLECVFTVDEETGMYGAEALELSVLSGNMLVNLDSEDEGTMLVSCAGGVRLDALFGFDKAENSKPALRISLSGLTGGHSGTEIDKNRPNAIFTVIRALGTLDGIRLCKINGGSADNAIPTDCQAVIAADCPEETKEKVLQFFDSFKEQYPDEKSVTVSVEETIAETSFSEKDTKTFLTCMGAIP